MAAPQSSPDLSVVSDSESGTPAPNPAEAGSQPVKKRRSVPLWLLLVAVVIGVVVSLSQYQRAEQLDARVVSLVAELQTAGDQLAAYQGHLDAVRTGVNDISSRMLGLKALADRDPLAPVEAPTGAPPVAGAGVNTSDAAAKAATPTTEAAPTGDASEEAATLPSVESAAAIDIGEALSDASIGAPNLTVAGDSERRRSVVQDALAAPYAPGRADSTPLR